MAQKNILAQPLLKKMACLEPAQRQGFHDYLSCPLFNTNATLLDLYQFLLDAAFQSNRAQLHKEELITALGISSSTGDKLLSLLLTLLNRFLALWEQRSDQVSELAVTFAAWHRQGLDSKLLELEYKKMKRKLPTHPASNTDLFHELQLENSYAAFKVNQPRKGDWEFFDRHLELLESYYQVSKLKYLCAAKSAGRVFRREEQLGSMRLSDDAAADLPPIGRAYFTAFSLLEANPPRLEEVAKCFGELEENGADFSEEDRGDLYGYLLNSCFRAAGAGEAGTEEMINSIYEAMLRQGLLMEMGFINSGHFKNIVSIKTRLGRTEEARRFIEANKGQLKEEVRESLVAFTLGIVAFYAGEYREAVEAFRRMWQVSNKDLIWNLEARKMHWKSYYEMYDALSSEEHTEMLRLYHSFRVYLSRDTSISAYHKEGYQNFIRLFNRLIRTGDELMWVSTLPELEALRVEVEEVENVVHKKWLLEAIDRKISDKKLGK